MNKKAKTNTIYTFLQDEHEKLRQPQDVKDCLIEKLRATFGT
jgi:hypothetical protein